MSAGSNSSQTNELVDHFFRHESGRLVASLSRVFGLANIDLVEDMVQAALVEALQSWRVHGVPNNPSGWIYRVAKNRALDALKHEQVAVRLAPERYRYQESHASLQSTLDHALEESVIDDSQLRMIFVCCHPELTIESQIALTLKTLCGFSIKEVARSLLLSPESVKKRIQRARQLWIDSKMELDLPAAELMTERIQAVHSVLYLMFNEGYCSLAGESVVREDLCEEAARLCFLLSEHEMGATPASFALLALMLFHAARLKARTDEDGRILLLAEQDRSLWDQRMIRRATQYLFRSGKGNSISCYHMEASIAFHHCNAASFAETPWAAILDHYEILCRIQPSPVYELNRAIALAQLQGPRDGIKAIDEIERDGVDYPLFDAVLGELYRQAGDVTSAAVYLRRAMQQTSSPAERQLLERRLLDL